MMALILFMASVTVTVSWTHSPSPDVTGYVISYGRTSHDYQVHKIVGYVTQTQVVGLDYDTTYYFAGLSTADDGRQSVYGTEAVYTTIPRPRPSAPGNFGVR